MAQIIQLDFNKTNSASGVIDIATVQQSCRKLKAGLIAPATEEVHTDLAVEHAAEPIKSMDDIIRISQFLIGQKRFRDNMLFIVGINFGLRISDLRSLRFTHIINDDCTFRDRFPILEKKTRNTRKHQRNRYITINTAVVEAVTLYLENTPNVRLSDYMFRSQSNNGVNENKPISKQAVDSMFKNSSYIKVVTASDNARSNRANILIVDEFRMVKKDTIDTVLKKFLTSRRMPPYRDLTPAERKAEYAKEPNKSCFLSSAYFKDHWSYNKMLDTFKLMLDDSKTDFVCGFPYQLSIQEGLLFPEDVESDMLESDFNEIKWSMEMEAMWFGAEDGSFFDFDSISKNRRISYPMLPDKLSALLGNSQKVKIPPKQNGERRILSADIALMSSKKHNNDASAVFINQMLPTKTGRFMSNIVYGDTFEGMHTEDQALVIRKLYDEYSCDYIVLDCTGLGLGVYDALVRDMVDPDTGEVYPALSCCNNQEMADRCTTKGADKVIWAIKGSPILNSECAVLLREGFRSSKIRLLITEYDGEALLSDIKGYNSLSPLEKVMLQKPYVHTTLLIDELVKLQHEESGGRVRVYEKSGMRKDRYSSLSYNYYVALQLESKYGRTKTADFNANDIFMFKPPKLK